MKKRSGGYRPGSGRKKKEPTATISIRVPLAIKVLLVEKYGSVKALGLALIEEVKN